MERSALTETAARRTGSGEGEAIRAREGLPATSVTLTIDGRSTAAPESVDLLDGGGQAYPRMLLAIARAQRSVHLEVYAFAPSGVGARFVEALAAGGRPGGDGAGPDRRLGLGARRTRRRGRPARGRLRGPDLQPPARRCSSAASAATIARSCSSTTRWPSSAGSTSATRTWARACGSGWADLALEIRGPQCARLGQMIRREPQRSVDSSLRIYLSGLGGGWRLRRRYLKAFASARQRIHVAHGYFLPDRGVVRAITRAARRGVQVRLLLAGRSDVPFARAATRSLYRRLLAAGVAHPRVERLGPAREGGHRRRAPPARGQLQPGSVLARQSGGAGGGR